MKLKLISQDNKQFANIGDLFGWDKNPKIVLRKDFDRLKAQITDLGQFKPLIVTPDGEVIGGNSRLQALHALGIDKVWVSVVNPKTDAEKIKYALADNDQIGDYVEEQLAELLTELDEDEINLEDYKISVGQDIDLAQVLKSIGVEDEPESAPQEEKKKTIKCPACGEEIEI